MNFWAKSESGQQTKQGESHKLSVYDGPGPVLSRFTAASSACSKSASRSRQSSMPIETSHQTVGHARLGELLLGESRMRGGLRMAHQRFHAAERYRVARQPQIAQEFEGGPFAAAQIERKHRARKIALRLINPRSARDRRTASDTSASSPWGDAPGVPRCAARFCSAGSCAARPSAGDCPASSIRPAAKCCRTSPRSDRIFWIRARSLASAKPPIRSLKPERYFVAEYSTRSAPSSRGCWNAGPSMVLSTITTGFSP